MKKDSLHVSTKYYFWKPNLAFFRGFELEEYVRTNVNFRHPILDLGGGDGIFSAMLQEIGVIDYLDISIDYAHKDILQSRKNTICSNALQGDARWLPLKSGVIGTVFANGVLSAIPPELDQAIKEVWRVLDEKGIFIVTVPIPRFNQNLIIPKVLRKVKLHWMADKYVTRIDRRLGRHRVLKQEVWLEKLKQAGFCIDQVCYYFTPRQALYWNLLMPHFFRVFSFLKIFKSFWIRQLMSSILEKIFRPVFEKEKLLTLEQKKDRSGCLLIVARKTSIGKDEAS